VKMKNADASATITLVRSNRQFDAHISPPKNRRALLLVFTVPARNQHRIP
jgi:hypothetical protein